MIIDHLWQKQKALTRLIYSLRSVQTDIKNDTHPSELSHSQKHHLGMKPRGLGKTASKSKF